MENWKSIKGYEGLYEISDHGRVKSLDARCYGKIKVNKKDKDGYDKVWLSKNSKKKPYFVHRLVAIHFIDNPENKPIVNHIDGVKDNNHVSNLEWATRSENDIHAFKLGLRRVSDGGTSLKVVRTDTQGNETIYNSMAEAARLNKMGVGSIDYRIKSGKFINGYKWRLYDEGVTTIREE